MVKLSIKKPGKSKAATSESGPASEDTRPESSAAKTPADGISSQGNLLRTAALTGVLGVVLPAALTFAYLYL